MKVYARPIETIAWFTKEGKPMPVKFKFALRDEVLTIKVDKVIDISEERLAGNRMFVYKCRSVIEGEEKLYELKYELNTCKWFMFKM